MLDGWGALVCNAGFNLVQDLERGTGADMLWPPSLSEEQQRAPYLAKVRAADRLGFCASLPERGLHGVTHDPALLDPLGEGAFEQYQGRELWRHASNIVFSSGRYDPWSAASVLRNLSASVTAIVLPQGAHHTDLMFATPSDPPSLREARAVERRLVSQWLRADEAVPGSGTSGSSSGSHDSQRMPMHRKPMPMPLSPL